MLSKEIIIINNINIKSVFLFNFCPHELQVILLNAVINETFHRGILLLQFGQFILKYNDELNGAAQFAASEQGVFCPAFLNVLLDALAT
jgi:hypothetical protein